MALTITVDGTDYTSIWRADLSRFSSRAHMGESTQSELVFDDDSGAAIPHLDLAARKVIEIWENASGSPKCLWRGRVANKTLGRGDISMNNSMRWTVAAEDYNIDFRGIRVTDSARPDESDYTRVLAYRNAYLNGASSTNSHARDSTTLGTTHILNSDTITLAAETYTDTFPDEVFRRICEMSGKTFFAYVDDAGAGQMYYALHTDTSFASTISINDTLSADNETIFSPEYTTLSGDHDGQSCITGGGIRYGSGQFYEESDIFGAEANHDKWEEHFHDEYVSNDAQAERLLEMIVASRDNERFSFQVELKMRADQVHLVKAGMTMTVRLAAADLGTAGTQRVVECTYEPMIPGWYLVTLELGFPRGGAVIRNLRPKPGPFPPAQPVAGVCTRLYHSAHGAGSGSTAESLASPNLSVSDLDAGWEGNNGGAYDVFQLYNAPASSVSGAASWAAVNSPAGQYAVRGYLKRLSGSLLSAIQAGCNVRMQCRASSRYGTGISEAAQDNYSAWAIRVFRPATGFIGTAVSVSAGGSSKFPAQATQVNRLWSAVTAAVSGAVEGDYVVLEIGTNHIGPTSGGTGAGVGFTDTAASDLGENESDTAVLNSWVEFCTGDSPGDAPGEVVNPGDEEVGDSGNYADADHTHPHGLLSPPFMHGALQVQPEVTHSDSDPTVNDDEADGYRPGWEWFNDATGKAFILADASTGAAVWKQISHPMTTAGDIIVGGTAGAPTRLGIGSDGHVLQVASGSVLWGAADPGGGSFDPDEHMPWRIDIDPFGPATNVNWSSISLSTARVHNGSIFSSGAQNDEISWPLILAAGTWKVSLVHTRNTNLGIYHVYIDASDEGQIDGYNGSLDNIEISSVSGVSVLTSGKHIFKIKMETKNASSSSYFGFLSAVTLERTA